MSTASQQDDQTQILRAVLRLYRQFGPDKVAMDDIAKATGRSRTALYYYYKNRNEVFFAAIDAIVLEVAKELREAVEAVQTLDEQVYTFCLSKLRISREWKLMLDKIWASMNSKDQPGSTRKMETLHTNLVHQESLILKEILTAAAERKEIRLLSEEEINHWVFVITSSIRGIRNEISDQNLTPTVKASIRVLSDMAVKWLKY